MKSCIKHKLVSLLFCMAAVLVIPLTVLASEDSLELYARSAVLMDGDSGRILYGKESDTPLPMASTTKIMTCIIALEAAEGDTICTVSQNAATQPPVKLGMTTGDTFYLKDLLYSLMLESHNDTAVCIAENIGGSVEGFAEKMNQKAKEIGCSDTYYITPNGLDAQDDTGEHHTTAGELALVMRYCLTQSPKTEEFLEITRTSTYTFTNEAGNKSYGCTNHNAFLTIMEGALSGKTGFTSKAGYCYVGALKRDDKLLIVALLACGWPNHKGYKWSDTKKLMNYGLENFEKKEIVDLNLQTGRVLVENGQQADTGTQVRQESVQLLLRSDDKIEKKIELARYLEAPVETGQMAGEVTYFLNGEEYVSFPVFTTSAVKKVNFLFFLQDVVEDLLL